MMAKNDTLNESPSYYSVLPAVVRYSKKLSDFQKVLFSEITALSNKWGYCNASNNFFADLYGKEPATISRCVSKLKQYGFIRVEIEPKNGNERRIYPTDQNATLLTKMSRDIDKNVKTPIDKNVKTPIDKNVKYNNTSINNTSINIKLNSEGEFLVKNEEFFWQWFWLTYDKNISEHKCRAALAATDYEERAKIIEKLPLYIQNTPEKRYRAAPLRWIGEKRWNDEIIQSGLNQKQKNGKSANTEDTIIVNGIPVKRSTVELYASEGDQCGDGDWSIYETRSAGGSGWHGSADQSRQ